MEDELYEALANELDVTQQKLKSKVKSIKILFKEYRGVCQEKDYYKTLISKLVGSNCNEDFPHQIYELTKENNILKLNNDDLNKKLEDVYKDLKVYQNTLIENERESRDRKNLYKTLKKEGKQLIMKEGKDFENIEILKEKFGNLQTDYKALTDNVDDLVTERDEYKAKFKRLNSYLNDVPSGSRTSDGPIEPRGIIYDIDKIITENRILMEEYDTLKAERDMLAARLNKQKHLGTNGIPSRTAKFGPERTRAITGSSDVTTRNEPQDQRTTSTINNAHNLPQGPCVTKFKARYDISSLYHSRERSGRELTPDPSFFDSAPLKIENSGGSSSSDLVTAVVSRIGSSANPPTNPFSSDTENSGADDCDDSVCPSPSLSPSTDRRFHTLKYDSLNSLATDVNN